MQSPWLNEEETGAGEQNVLLKPYLANQESFDHPPSAAASDT